MQAIDRIAAELKTAGIRIKIDDRDNLSPGYKFNDWEMRGVPTRIEIGPRDVAKNSVALARRDKPGREGKQFVSQDGLAETVAALLAEIQQAMLDKASRFQDDNTHETANYDQFKEAVQSGFARVWWAGTNEEEARVKEETKATIRCFPLDQPDKRGTCFYTGRPADRIAIFGKAY
jgi:prolyl-tRNA synthetase